MAEVTLSQALSFLTQAILLLTFLATLVEYLRHRGRERADIALMFGSLGVTTLVSWTGQFLGYRALWFTTLSTVAILAHPYLMVRLLGQFRRVPRAVVVSAFVGFVASAGASAFFAVTDPAPPGAPSNAPEWLTALIIVYFAAAEGYAAFGLVAEAVRAEGVARKRLRYAAGATGLLSLLIALAGVGLLLPPGKEVPAFVSQGLGFACIAMFYVAFSPPAVMRKAWSREELEDFLAARTGRTVSERADESIDRLATAGMRLTAAESAFVATGKPGAWRVRRLLRGWPPQPAAPVDLSGGLVDRVAGTRRRAVVRDPFHHSKGERSLLNEAAAVLAVPVQTRSRLWGVLVVPFERAPLFVDETARLLELLAEQTASDLELRSLAEEQEETRLQDLRRQNVAIQEANRLKSEFLANMSHELRTPLNSIIGFAELMHSGKVGEPEPTHKEFLGDILTSSRHLLQLINDVLDLAKVEAGRMDFTPEPVDVGALVEETLVVVRPLAERKDIRIAVERADGLDGVVLDAVRFKQVLYNFLSNAIKFTLDKGKVVVRLVPQGAAFRVEVQDTGVGIRPEDVPKLFREFQQLDSGMAKSHQGTGLGLALTKRIVEAQGGAVGVESVPGKGSTFHAVFPRKTAADASVVRAPVTGAASVLVVEDELDERRWIASELRAQGYVVETAASGREALDLISRRDYAAVTLDLLLPDMHGFDVLQRIREKDGASVAVVVVTQLATDKVRTAYAVDGILQKPVDGATLAAALRQAGVTAADDRPVLVVDDDVAARKLVETHVRAIGHRVLGAGDGEQALAAAERDPPSAVILDLLMPNVDGFQFLDRFRAARVGRGVPVIVWTSKDLSPDEKARLSGAVQLVLYKSEGDAFELMNRLEAALRQREAVA